MALDTLTWQNFVQLTASGVSVGALYAMVGLGFWLILGVTGRFHFAYSVTISGAALLSAILSERTSVAVSFALALLAAAVFGVAIERLAYEPIERGVGASSLLAIFVTSLGIVIVATNLMQVYWAGRGGSRSIKHFTVRGFTWSVGDVQVTLTNVDLIGVVLAIALLGLVVAALRVTRAGRVIRAVQVNRELAETMGVRLRAVHYWVFVVGSVLGAVTGICLALKTAATPGLGATLVLYAFIVAFLSGLSSKPGRVIAVGIGLGVIRNWTALVMSTLWTDLVVFVLLLVIVCARAVDIRRLLLRWKPAVAR